MNTAPPPKFPSNVDHVPIVQGGDILYLLRFSLGIWLITSRSRHLSAFVTFVFVRTRYLSALSTLVLVALDRNQRFDRVHTFEAQDTSTWYEVGTRPLIF